MPLFPNYSACTWSLTPLSAGSLVGDSYDMDINSLSPSTIYEYRAYAVIGGEICTGNTLTGCTDAVPTSMPDVETGSGLSSILGTSMLVKWSSLIDNGGIPIAEYGHLFTQVSAYGNDANLRYENAPTNVCKNSAFSAITNGTQFKDSTAQLSGLTPNTLTYFRAFAKNANGVGYGDIETQLTNQPIIPVDVCLFRVYTAGINSANGCVCFNPLLETGQYVEIAISIDHCVQDSGYAITEVFCKPAGVPTYTLIEALNTDSIENFETHSFSVPLSENDSLCWQHSNTGNYGSWSTIRLASIGGHSIELNPTINSTYYCDCVYT